MENQLSVQILIVIGALLALGFFMVQRRRSKVESLRRTGVYPRAGEETEADVDRLILKGHKIEAIKVFRALHDVDLKEAKEAVEKRQRELGRR
jgi:ribosomal protein L7/L12